MSFKILAIEDEITVLDTIKDILTYAGYEVDSASNGEIGLQKAFDNPPDLILCDIVMPGLDGYQLLQQIKSNPLTSAAGFIFLSARTDVDDVKKGMMLGANDYITKPFTIVQLLERVSAQFEKQDFLYSRESYQIQNSGTFHELSGLGSAALLESHLEHFKRDRDKKIALLVIKIKKINEYKSLLDHNETRLLQKQVLDRIRNNLSEKQRLYYFSTGKYAVLFESPENKAPEILAWDILSAIRNTLHLQHHTLHLTAYIGIAVPSGTNQSENLIDMAEISLERAMDTDQNRYLTYKPEYKKPYHDIQRMDIALSNALGRDEMMLVYQPKFNLMSSRISGFEVLLRWNHPQFGAIPPSRFIPLAEALDFIGEIGDWVIGKAIDQLKVWEFSGEKLYPLTINISERQIKKKEFYQNIQHKLSHADIDVGYIEFDLTESIFIHNPVDLKTILELLRSAGISLSLDDFGMGCSSLAYINNFPFSKIKIDKSYIHDIPLVYHARELVAGIISMAKKIGLKVIAEGVENEQQVEFLHQNKCDEIQGFYYGRPVPAEQLKTTI